MKAKIILMTLLLSISSVLIAGSDEDHDGNCHDKQQHKSKTHDGKHHKGKHHKGKHAKNRRMEKLNLTEDQQKSFDEIMENKRASMKAAMEVIHIDTHAALAKVLTDEQMKMLDDAQDKRHDKKEERKEKRKERKMKKQEK